MARSATLDVRVLLDAAQAASGLNEVAGKFESFGKKLTSAVIGAVAIGGITELAKTVVSSASTMQQAVGGTDKVFGANASAIHSWASDTTDSIRLPAAAVEKFATLIRTQLAATGEPIDKLTADTKKLVQIGADLAAVTGADLSDAIAAVKSALAGEFDPIQNLGVAMTAATVNAKALEIAHGDLAAASSSTVQEQARVAEIMDKSAFATGAAAEETDTFQGKVDSLKEQASGLAVAIGGPLLDSLGHIVGSIGDAAAGATTMGTGFGVMLGSVLALPGPIQAIGAGLLAFAAISAKWGAAASGAFTSFIGSIKTATTSVGGLKAALAGIGPALAGGALIVGAAVLIGLFAQAIGRVTEGAKKGEDALQGYRDAIVAAGGASTDATAEAFKQAVTTSDAFKGLIESGFSAADAVKILTGTQEDWIAVQSSGSDAAQGLTKDTAAMVDGFIDANGHAKTLAQAQLDGAAAMNASGDAAKQLGPTIAESEQAAADAATKAAEAQKAMADAMAAAKKAADATAANTLLNGIAFAAESSSRAIAILSGGIDQIAQKDTFEATNVSWIRSLDDLPAKFQAAKDAGQLYGDALVNWDAIQLQTGEGSRALYDALKAQGEQFPTIVSNAFEAAGGFKNLEAATAAAKGAASDARTNFINLAADFLGGAENAGKLADKLGIIDGTQISDKLFEVIATDEAARAKVAQLQAEQIGAKNFDITAGADGAIGTVDDLISYVDAAGNAMPPVPIHADAASGEKTAADFTGEKRQTNEVAILANSAPARNAMNAFLSDYSNMILTVTLNGNTAPARNAMNSFRSEFDNFPVTTTILGNSAPARSAIAAVENGSYSATVRVLADTSAFFSAFNSLPGSKGVAVAPNTVVSQTFAAPTLRGAAALGAPVAARNVSTGATVNITVQGAIDPDSTARQIRNILKGQDRRSGGISI